MKKIILALSFLVFSQVGISQIGSEFQEHSISGSQYLTDIFPVDMDGDGDIDLLYSGSNAVWRENVEGAWGNPIKVLDGYFDIIPVDFDNDGDMDIYGSFGYDDINSQNHYVFGWYTNNNFEFSLSGGQQLLDYLSETFADIDGDGDLDWVYRHENGAAYWQKYDGSAGLQDTTHFIGSFAYGSCIPGDIDNDGKTDILSWVNSNAGLIWNRNLDGENFSTNISILTTPLKDVKLADLDGDENLDIIILNGENLLSWLKNDGLGGFGPTIEIANVVYSFDIADMDNDGDLDIVTSGPKLEWQENLNSIGTSWNSDHIISNLTGISFHIEDLDSDGDMDIITYNWGGNIKYFESISPQNRIVGVVSLDADNNNCASGSQPVSGILMQSMNDTISLATLSSNLGIYSFHQNAGTYTTSVVPSEFYEATPISQESILGEGTKDTVNFCLTINQDITNLSVSLYPINPPEIGQKPAYRIVCHNSGYNKQAAKATLQYDEGKLVFVSSSIPVLNQTANTMTFDLDTIAPFETKELNLIFNILTPPAVVLGDTLSFAATVNPNENDYNPADNTFEFNQTVVSSYDPNDIKVLEGAEVNIENKDEYLHYIIRFQNTGTAPAHFVKVASIIDPNLDWSTFQVETSSHTNSVELVNEDTLNFIFSSINLPDSTHNEAASHGYIGFKIKPKNGVGVGTIIKNQASIFFDYNEPVETNKVSTEYIDVVALNLVNPTNIKVYPTPTTETFSLDSQTAIKEVLLYNEKGQIVLKTKSHSQIDISTLAVGTYFCKVTDAKGVTSVVKLIKE